MKTSKEIIDIIRNSENGDMKACIELCEMTGREDEVEEAVDEKEIKYFAACAAIDLKAKISWEYAVQRLGAGEKLESSVAKWFDTYENAWKYVESIKLSDGERVEVARAFDGDFDDYLMELRMEDGNLCKYYNGELIWALKVQ